MIPDYQTLMLPVLKSCAEGEIATNKIIKILTNHFDLSDIERTELLPSGKRTTFENRVQWAKTYLKQAGLLEYPKRSYVRITEVGQQVLSKNVERIDNNFLMRFDSFIEFRNRKGTSYGNKPDVQQADVTLKTPDEALRSAYDAINDALASDLISKVRSASPAFFEELIIELLTNMGYGGTSEASGCAIGGGGDNGIDGVINQDPLGVDQIYIQAKRYAEENTIGSGAIRDFFGALNLKNAQKGLFFTTSSFTRNAVQTARDLGMRIVLIDGHQLTKLMIEYNVGCREEEVLNLKKVDEDFFDKGSI